MNNSDEKIHKLSLLEQNLNNLMLQKQNFQMQNIEIENALSELENSKESYQIIGNIMIKGDKNKIKKDLESKKEIIDLRIKNLEKQEEKIKEESNKLQKDVIRDIKK